MQKLKQTFICSLSWFFFWHQMSRSLWRLTAAKQWNSSFSTSGAVQGARGSGLQTVVWFHTTFGQTSPHDSAVKPRICSLCFISRVSTLAHQLSVVSVSSAAHSTEHLSNPLPRFSPPHPWTRLFQANAADYTLMFGWGDSVVPPAGSSGEIAPLCLVRTVKIRSAEVSAGASRQWWDECESGKLQRGKATVAQVSYSADCTKKTYSWGICVCVRERERERSITRNQPWFNPDINHGLMIFWFNQLLRHRLLQTHILSVASPTAHFCFK